MSTEFKRLSSHAYSLNKDSKAKQEQETGLKGAFVSVMLIGVFLVVTWTLVFILLISSQ
jgi:MFS superfamily sulfate permease-like transporter